MQETSFDDLITVGGEISHCFSFDSEHLITWWIE